MKAGTQNSWAYDLAADLAGGVCYAVGMYVFAMHADFDSEIARGADCQPSVGCAGWTGDIAAQYAAIRVGMAVCWTPFLRRTLRSMLICVLLLDGVFPHLPVYTGDPFLAALYSGAFLGTGLALFYMHGSSSGGMDLLTMTIKKLRPHLSVGAVMMAIDLVVILLGWPVFGNVDAVLYGMTAVVVTAFVLDKIMYGAGACKLVIIITDAGQAVARRIAARCGRGSTQIRALGSYTGTERYVLLCACGKAQAYKVRTAAHEIDRGAFVMVTEASEVFGEGFSAHSGTQE